MKRNYTDGLVSDSIDMFVGREVEHTPAHNKLTLFVVGVQKIADIEEKLIQENCEHIFFAANQSFDPAEFCQLERTMLYFLQRGVLCSLDVPGDSLRLIEQSALLSYNNFIPQVCVKIPNINKWKNATLKLDDIDFNATNPGVWCHQLKKLQIDSVFTDWSKYNEDKPV